MRRWCGQAREPPRRGRERGRTYALLGTRVRLHACFCLCTRAYLRVRRMLCRLEMPSREAAQTMAEGLSEEDPRSGAVGCGGIVGDELETGDTRAALTSHRCTRELCS